MIYQAKLPESWWDYAVAYAVWLKNRSPTCALPLLRTAPLRTQIQAHLRTQIPFEAWTGNKPNVSKARVFGCAAYPFIPQENRRKLDSRIRASYIFVGMKGQSQWRLVHISSRKELISVDVRFNEYIYPKSGYQDKQQMLGQVPELRSYTSDSRHIGHVPEPIRHTFNKVPKLLSYTSKPSPNTLQEETNESINQRAVKPLH
jgi:hypothetical protein